MRRIVAILLIPLLFALVAFPDLGLAQSSQPALRPGRNLSDVPNRSTALDNLAAKNRARLTNEWVMSAGVINSVYSTPTYTTLTTYVLATTVPTTFHALKAAVASDFNAPLQIVSLNFYPSDSFSGIAAGQAAYLAGSTKTSAWPTANSVYLSCTANNTTTVTCPSTATIPTGTLEVFGSCIGINTGTITNSTTVTLAIAATCSAGGQNITVQFANPATACKGYFDNQGADGANVNGNGVSSSLFIPPTTTNPTNANVPFTLQWSDYVPCNSVTPADGSTLPIVFVYMTLGPNTNAFGRSGTSAGNLGYNTIVAPAFGSRYTYGGVAWDGNTDWSATPNSDGYKGANFSNPILAVAGVSENYGQMLLQLGDSISAAPPDFGGADGGGVRRGCWSISTIARWCEVMNFAWGGQQYALYGQNAQNNIGGRRFGSIIVQPISRNESGGPTLAAYYQLLSSELNLASEREVRIGFLGAFPFTTTLDGNTSYQTQTATMRALLNSISTTCQPGTGGLACPKIPVLDPVPIVSRAAVGGNFWDYLGLAQTANGATAAGATSIPITVSSSVVACYVGDTLIDVTTPAAILAGSTVSAATTTALTVANTAVIGSGIVNGDTLECAAPGYNGPALTFDNTHPWNNAWSSSYLLPLATAFVQQLLGY